jgi:glycosyltransferase involved in cell wall biosynthesis
MLKSAVPTSTARYLRVLHIGKYFPPFSGGVENYMRDAMVALAKRGIDSIALVHRHSFSLRSREELVTASGHQLNVTRTGMWARLLYTPISPTFPWHIRRLIKSARPDILHLHLPNPSVFWTLALPSARRIPWVVHWHADVITEAQGLWMKLFYLIYRPFESAVLKHAHSIVATSSPYRDSSFPLRKWLFKCQVVPLGVDVARFGKITCEDAHPAGSESVGGASVLQILAIGRLTYYKGFRYMIEAAAKVTGVHISLVGEGDQAEELKSLVNSLELQDRIHLEGHLSNDLLARKMAECECLCLPSIERTEAFGMVLLEAMYFGKATVISDVTGSGMGWIVDDGITGIKVRPANPDALAEAFKRLMADREELHDMGRRGKEKFDQQFEINHAVEGLIEIYQDILGTSHNNQNKQATDAN